MTVGNKMASFDDDESGGGNIGNEYDGRSILILFESKISVAMVTGVKLKCRLAIIAMTVPAMLEVV